jgi:hypothetical protein
VIRRLLAAVLVLSGGTLMLMLAVAYLLLVS